jgi:uncharacterized membrane protein
LRAATLGNLAGGFLLVVALLHAAFMLLELFPWESPFLLGVVTKKLPAGDVFTPHQRDLVATIVQNAATYNGILAAGLAWAALTGESAHDVARVLLALSEHGHERQCSTASGVVDQLIRRAGDGPVVTSLSNRGVMRDQSTAVVPLLSLRSGAGFFVRSYRLASGCDLAACLCFAWTT